MPSFTKKAIVESFLYLAGKKPLDKITVRDVVDDCGINRNTFYYYFQDIYAVLEELCRNLIDDLPTDAPLSDTLLSFFERLYRFSLQHPRTSHGLLMSLSHDEWERYFATGLDRVILTCLLREHAAPMPERAYLEHLTDFLYHAVFGYCMDFFKDEKSHSFEEAKRDLSQILQSFSAMLQGNQPDKK